MADNYTHQFSARNALRISGYTPRDLPSFILGANGPDPLFCYQMHNPLRKYNLSDLGSIMHKEKTGQFLQNLFRLAQTDAQKDYCLGFLCHYSMDSTIHPYVNYLTSAYGSPFNIPSGHGYFESALDSLISLKTTGAEAAKVSEYFPEIKKLYLDQIISLFKNAVDVTYTNFDYPRSEYALAFRDFKSLKGVFYSPNKGKFPLAFAVEKLFHFKDGYVMSHMQPCLRPINDLPVWENQAAGLFSIETLEEILQRADYLSAQSIGIGLEYFKGGYNIYDLLEDIGNKSYETGVAI